jgi:RNA polymerase sigma-70 factor (ECF subfamily)
MHRMSEATLITAVRRGDATAFDSLYRAHAEKLVRTVQRITRNHEDAEDAAQDSFLRAFTHFDSFDGRSTFATWLTRIGINSALMILRKKRGLPEAAVPSSTHTEVIEAVPDTSPDPEELYESLERKRILESAITRLSQKTKEAVELHFLQERSLPEAARQLGVSLTVAKARVFHAKTALRKSKLLRQINGRTSGAEGCRIVQTAAPQPRRDRYSVVVRFGPTQAESRLCSYQQSGHGCSTASANRSIPKRTKKEGEQNETEAYKRHQKAFCGSCARCCADGHDSAAREDC